MMFSFINDYVKLDSLVMMIVIGLESYYLRSVVFVFF